MKRLNLNIMLALGLSAGLVACDGGEKKKDEGKAEGKADAKGDDAKGDDAKGDDAKGDDAKAEDGGGEGGDAAAGDNPLIGTWELDPEALKEMEEYKNASDDEKKMMEGLLSAMKMEITFAADSMKMSMAMGDKKEDKEGKYTIKSNEGGTVVIESEVDGKKEELTVTVKDGVLTMEQGKQKMAFKKKG